MKRTWVSIKLVIITIAVALLQIIAPQLTENFVLQADSVFYEPWTLVTYIFMHGGILHLLYNMIALGLFGFILENIIGEKRFLYFYIISGIVSGLASLALYPAVIGASGAVFGILGLLAVLRPTMTVYVSYLPMPMFVAVAIWAGGNILGLFAPDEVAYAGHLAGLILGLVYGLWIRKKGSYKR